MYNKKLLTLMKNTLENNAGLLIGLHLLSDLPPCGLAETHNIVLQQIPTELAIS